MKNNLLPILLLASASVIATSKKVLSFISYNDVYELQPIVHHSSHHNSSPYSLGGASRVAHYIKNHRSTVDNETVVLFAGDTLSPSIWSTLFKGEQMIAAHNELGIDAACLGNHEFDFGIETFVNVTKKSNFPWLNSNVYETSSHKLLRGTSKTLIKTVKGIKIGFFGVLYDMKEETPEEIYITDPEEAAALTIAELKSQEVDMIVALTHQYWRDDNAFASSPAISHNVDIIFGGHDHKAMYQSQYKVPYVKSDQDWKNIWVSSLIYSHSQVVSMTHTNVPITEDFEKDLKMESIITSYENLVGEKYNVVIGSSGVDLDLSQYVVRAKEAIIGNFIADAMANSQSKHKKIIATMNGGGIRSNKVFRKGPITFGDVIEWLPFGNKVFVLKVTGETLRQYLAETSGESCLGGQNGALLHPSGFKYVIDCTKVGGGIISDLTLLNDETTPILPTDELVLALPDFLYECYDDSIFRNSSIIKGHKDSISIAVHVANEIKKQKVIHPVLESRLVTVLP